MKAVFEVIRDKRVVANFITYDGHLYQALDLLIDMVKNYNEKLASSSLYPELLALRFFEQKDEEGLGRYMVYPKLKHTSRRYVADNYPKFKLTPEPNTSDRNGVIAITDGDMFMLKNMEKQIITINLDVFTVYFKGCFEEFSKKEYEDLGLSKVADLNTYEYDLFKLHFNELEDARDFIESNIVGWIKKDDPDTVILPNERID